MRCLYFFLLLTTSCATTRVDDSKNNFEKKKLGYYIYYDKFTKKDISILNEIFEKNELSQDLPPGVFSISFNIYSVNLKETNSLYLDINGNKETWGDEISSFKKGIESNLDSIQSDIVIFNNLDIIFRQMDTTNINEIILISDLFENSGGSIDDPKKQESWMDGQFRFIENIDGTNYFIPDHIQEAERQLSDTNSWIYVNLIEKSRSISKNLKVTILKPNRIRSLRTGIYDINKVEDFWDLFWKKAGIKIKNSKLRTLSDYIIFPS